MSFLLSGQSLFFFNFSGAKEKVLKFLKKYCSVRTKKLHRIKIKKSKKNWEVFFTGKKTVFLGLKISMYVLRPSDQASVGFYCASASEPAHLLPVQYDRNSSQKLTFL